MPQSVCWSMTRFHPDPGAPPSASAIARSVAIVPRHLEYAAGEGLGPLPFQLLGTALDELVAAGVLPGERRPDAEYPVWSCVHGLAVLVTRGPLRDMPGDFVRHVGDPLFAFITRGL